MWFSLPGWNNSSYEEQKIYPTAEYDVVASTWTVTSEIRADSGQLTGRDDVLVYAFLYPERFGGGGARVQGALKLEMMPDGDKLVK